MMRGFLSLGSNLGDREALLRKAIDRLARRHVAIVQASRIYETKPVEVGDVQGNYLNMVLKIAFEGDPVALLDVCQDVEASLGRVRTYEHAPRSMDIDILLLEGFEVNDARLRVPHPRMEHRAFVIHPLADVAPDLTLPSGRMVADVGKGLGNDEILTVWDR